ncbi:hypothetical protein MPH_02057 [Macrophomina phaseolina MS6]|uniref:Uncharacterized protein n=2 Tax=Macrophomina phaseolina TaxID=35725 RepID=K2SV98_MACPH|nr:hypothetical protein MPH_02057 [Macrophomina phaseolina MS6]KAH7038543.1 hypothetical protein B0J12DRAFT_257177 [Macrophomina phaseolina]
MRRILPTLRAPAAAECRDKALPGCGNYGAKRQITAVTDACNTSCGNVRGSNSSTSSRLVTMRARASTYPLTTVRIRIGAWGRFGGGATLRALCLLGGDLGSFRKDCLAVFPLLLQTSMPADVTHPPRRLGHETNRRRARAGQLFCLQGYSFITLSYSVSVREFAINTDTWTHRPTKHSNTMISRSALSSPTRNGGCRAFLSVFETHITLQEPGTQYFYRRCVCPMTRIFHLHNTTHGREIGIDFLYKT